MGTLILLSFSFTWPKEPLKVDEEARPPVIRAVWHVNDKGKPVRCYGKPQTAFDSQMRPYRFVLMCEEPANFVERLKD